MRFHAAAVKVLLVSLVAGLPFQAANAKGAGGSKAALLELRDRAELKEVVDTFSILADKKDVHRQVMLFTPDATLEIFVNGAPSGSLKGRDALENAFRGFLAGFQTVYHFNGQQQFTTRGDKATGVSYCMVTLIAVQDGKRFRTTMGVHYEDEFVRVEGKWLISVRRSNFDWQDRQPMS
jgi:hypothetical protein